MYWMILTGEYPPQPGGVSDYTRAIARALAAQGDEVHVWAPPVVDAEPPGEGVTVHRLADRYGWRSLRQLSRALAALPRDARLLVQYVPQAFGWDTMNVPFCAWLAAAGRRQPLDMMFHEVAVDWENGFPSPRRLRRQLHAATTALMARLACRAAQRIFMSIPGWEPILRPIAVRAQPEWLPIPSTMPTDVDAGRVALLGEQLRGGVPGAKLLGHFGTFGGHIADALRVIIPAVSAAQPGIRFVLIGRGSIEFAATMPGQVLAVGALEPAAVVEHLAACDLLVQPYIDGVSSRRTSVMASLALGLPVLTTTGHLTEPIWAASGAVCLAASNAELSAKLPLLLADESALAALRAAAAKLYRERFQIGQIVTVLRRPSP